MFMIKHIIFLEMYVLTEVLLCHEFGTWKNGNCKQQLQKWY